VETKLGTPLKDPAAVLVFKIGELARNA